MKPKTLIQLKKELAHRSGADLLELCLRLAKYKKENKELLSYLLFESADEDVYIEQIKEEITEQFLNINKYSYYHTRKAVSKILRLTKKYIKYSDVQTTEIELLMFFLNQLKTHIPHYFKSAALENVYFSATKTTEKAIAKLHPDLQYDYGKVLEEM